MHEQNRQDEIMAKFNDRLKIEINKMHLRKINTIFRPNRYMTMRKEYSSHLSNDFKATVVILNGENLQI